jgi:transposase-like protein
MRRHVKPTDESWRVDETYVRVQGRWCYLYRAIDSAGATVDFLLSALRDADAAKRLFRNALSDLSHPQPRVINPDLAPIYGVGHRKHKEGRDPRQSVPSSTSPVFEQHYRTRTSSLPQPFGHAKSTGFGRIPIRDRSFGNLFDHFEN